MKEIQSEFKFLNYFVNYIKFNFNKNYNNEECTLKTKFDYVVEKNDIYEVTLIAEVGDELGPFVLSASITGNFEISSDNIKSEDIEILINQNALAILFPYLRSLISTVTANCNISPVILPTINITKLVKD